MWEEDNQRRYALLRVSQVTQQDIQDAMKHSVYRNKKKYYRKTKHKNNGKY